MKAKKISIEPPWAGFERSIENFILWFALTLILIPVPLGAIFYGLWTMGTGHPPNILVMYALGLFIGSIPFLWSMEKGNRLYLHVESQKAVIVTNDLPASKERESSDSREETPLHGVKLGEGTHVLNPFDQVFATIPIEIDYQVNIVEAFRVTIGKNHMKDLMVKGFTADFKTDSEHLLALARISTKDDERKTKVEARMRNFIQRFIEEECRKIAGPLDDDTDPSEKSNKISENVKRRIIRLLKKDYPGFELKSFTIGNIDKPKKVEDARDLAAQVEQMTIAAANMLKLNLAEGAPADSNMSPQEATDTALTAAGIKTATKKESGFKIDRETVNVLGKLAEALIRAFK